MFAGEFVQVLQVKADTVVFDAQGKVLLVEHADFDVLGFGVFADVGQAFLQDEDDLQLFVIIQCAAVVLPYCFDIDFGLAFKPGQQGGYGFREVFVADFGSEIQQEFAHVFVTFLYAVFDEADVFFGLFFLVGMERAFQHLNLKIEEGQCLGDAVVQTLGDQVALLEYGKQAPLLFETAAGDGYT